VYQWHFTQLQAELDRYVLTEPFDIRDSSILVGQGRYPCLSGGVGGRLSVRSARCVIAFTTDCSLRPAPKRIRRSLIL
jgi:hypothetical protein